jgi:hypothetical protein
MNETEERPQLEFFRKIPRDLMSRPPLYSSLQNLESSFFFIALDRFPHALVMCASAIESAMKSALGFDPEKFITANKLYATAINQFPSLSSFDEAELEHLRFLRNRIVHYGFGPQDDEESAVLLLKAGYPFLMACFKEFFEFDLVDSLKIEFGKQFGIVFNVYINAKGIPASRFTYCFHAFGHLIRWSVRESLMSAWEVDASIDAEESLAKFDYCMKRKHQIERVLDESWVFKCPICDEIDTFVCEIDQDRLYSHIVSFTRGECANCGLVVPNACLFLIDALCREQIDKRSSEILQDFGIGDE